MNKRKVLIMCAGFILFFAAFSQEITEKKEIAVFALSYYDPDIPEGVLGNVDNLIKDVFVNLGRFTVTGMEYRLSEADVSGFIDRIRQTKENLAEIPENVRLGEETFTESDFNRLVGSFIVVVPEIVSYLTEYDDKDNEYTVEMTTGFSFISIDSFSTIAHFTIQTIGSGKYPRDAGHDAVTSIPAQLAFRIRSIDEFQLKTGILDISGNRILVELGKDMGIRAGDEFSLIKNRVLPTGHIVTEEIGLIEVTEVLESVSYARVVYSGNRPVIGDQLREIPRFGVEVETYANMAYTNLGYVILPGLRMVPTRGLRRVRPVLALEVPLNPDREIVAFGLPVTLLLGAELNWSIGRIQFLPSISFGLSGIIPFWELDEEDPEFCLSHVGGSAQFGISCLVTRDIRVQLHAGALFYSSVFINSRSYTGAYGGVSVKFKT